MSRLSSLLLATAGTALLASCGMPLASAPQTASSLPQHAAKADGRYTLLTVSIQADAFPSIQAAIDSLAGTGGTVYLGAHDYTLSSTLVVPSNVALIGQDDFDANGNPVRSCLKLANGANKLAITNKAYWTGSYTVGNLATYDTNIRLENFDIDGNRVNQTGGSWAGVGIGYAQNLTIDDLKITDCAGSGIRLLRTHTSLVQNCDTSHNAVSTTWAATGIDLGDYCADNTVQNNVCNYNNENVTLSGTNPYDGNGIRLGDYSHDNLVQGNTCTGNGRRGIKVQGFDNTVKQNTMSANTGQAIALHGPVVDGNLIEGNTITVSTAIYNSGIIVADIGGTSSNNIIRQNVITGALYGVEVTSAAGQTIDDNTISLSRGHGIFLRGTSGNVVQYNDVTDSGQGVSSNGIQIIVEGGRASLNNQILDNVCTDTHAVWASKTQAYSLRTNAGVDQTTVSRNDFRGNKWYGISLSGTANTVTPDNLY